MATVHRVFGWQGASKSSYSTHLANSVNGLT